MRGAAIVSFLVVIGAYSFGIYTTYYTYCGYQAYAGSSCVLPIYKNIEKEGVPEVKINAETTVSQTFTLECNGLESVSVYVKSLPENKNDALKFSLLDENQNMLAEENIPLSEIAVFDYLTLPINPIIGTHGDNFEIKLEASNLNPLDGVGIGYIMSGFHDGEFSAAGQAKRYDLIYHYVCAQP